jgi:acyl carrier protein
VPTPQSLPDNEQILAAVVRAWSGALNVGKIQPTDNFFSLGGNSLIALRTANQLSGELGVQLSIRVLFEHSDLQDYVREIERMVKQQEHSLGEDAR